MQLHNADIPRPDCWALIYALGYKLWRPSMNVQIAADAWYCIMSCLWDWTRDRCSLISFPRIRKWAVGLHKTSSDEEMADTEQSHYLTFGKYLTSALARVVQDNCELDTVSDVLDRLNTAMDDLSFLKRRRAVGAIREIRKAIDQCGPRQCPFRVTVNQMEPPKDIFIDSFGEVLSIDGYRIRPHKFWYDMPKNSFVNCDIYHVTQVCGLSDQSGYFDHIDLDTIVNDNLKFPFWPKAAVSDTERFSHRCSTHNSRGRLAWSDWPQVVAGLTDVPTLWRFITGVFRQTQSESIDNYQLVARVEWEVDWDTEGVLQERGLGR